MPSRSERRQVALDSIEPFLADWRARSSDPHAAFRDWAVEQVLWDEELSSEEVLGATAIDGGGDMGIDAWHYAKESSPKILYLVQSKDMRVKVDDLAKIRDGFLALFNPARSILANEEAKLRASEFAESMDDDIRVEFHLVTSDIAPQPVRAHAAAMSQEPLSIFERSLECSFQVHDIEELSQTIRIAHVNPINAVFRIDSKEFFQFVNNGFRTVTAVVSARQLVDLFNKERTNLFRLNPRYYQTARTKVNQSVLTTLLGSDRQNFYLYNNGITAVCSGVSTEESRDTDARVRLIAQDFQIVNGCQTTVTLYEAWRRGAAGYGQLDGIHVPLRIIEAAPAIAPQIARSTNSQNPMKAEDFRSNEPRQIQLHVEFGRMRPPWFYEHKRGVWATEYRTRQSREVFTAGTDRARLIKMKDLAQACLAFLGQPSDAADKAAAIFEANDLYERVFPDSVRAVQLLLPYLLYLKAHDVTRTAASTVSWAPYLRYSLVSCVSQLIHEMLGHGSAGYLSPTDSEQLVARVNGWATDLFKPAFDELSKHVRKLNEEEGSGARSIVRRRDWLDDPYDRVSETVRNRLRTEAEVAQQQGVDAATLGLRSRFPLPIALLLVG